MFVKGKSGNPAGRPKKDLVTAHLERELLALDGSTNATNARRVAEKAVELAKQGHPWAVQFVTERTEGKPEQVVSIRQEVTELDDSELQHIAAGSSDRASEAQEGTQGASSVH